MRLVLLGTQGRRSRDDWSLFLEGGSPSDHKLKHGHLSNGRKNRPCDDHLLCAGHYDRLVLTFLFLIIITPYNMDVVVLFQMKELRLEKLSKLLQVTLVRG